MDFGPDKNVVSVGSWMTKCLVCKKNVLDGSDNTHKVTGGGWENLPQEPGCGVVWTHVYAETVFPGVKERVQEMYPGLEYIGFEG